jgi:hypothetical protein
VCGAALTTGNVWNVQALANVSDSLDPERETIMSTKSFALAGAAIVALSMGASIAQADDQDDEVRQLNIEQLEKAKAGGSDAPATAPMPASQPDGQGGPELQGPPTPDEGMKDEPADEPAAEEGDEPATDDPAKDEDQPEPKPE